jgi:acetylornithine deacetylase/succinyl-diaminopimelate desuccinylase-like protein
MTAPQASGRALESVLDNLDRVEPAALDRLFRLLAIPSISTDPAFHEACIEAAEACADALRDIGFEARVEPTLGKPMVVGHRHAPPERRERPRVLFYGHYDVQPPDPLPEWKAPPFEPRLVNDPRHDKIIVDEFRADIALVCDTGQWDADTPAITAFLRGLAFSEITLSGPSRDLHSGLYGGPALNPLRVLSEILAALRDEQGRVVIPGFYDDVRNPSPTELEVWRRLGFDAGGFLGAVGLSTPAGERGFSVLEQLWSRPTAEINGIVGGYGGPGTKTVIPTQAVAKLSFRLVPGQEPHKILAALHRFVEERLPADASVSFAHEGGSRAVGFDMQAPAFQAAARALEAEWGKKPVVVGCGASIPIVESFRGKLGMDSLLIGFALDDDRIHSPNEKYNLRSFTKGARSWARILAELGAIDVTAST